MDYSISTEKLISELPEDVWVQVHDFTPQDDEKRGKYGRLLAIISLSSTEHTEDKDQAYKTSLGREVLTRLHEEYFGRELTDNLMQLQEALQSVCREFSGNGWRVEIAAAVVLGRRLYLSAAGGSIVKLLRRGSLVDIIGSKERAEDTLVASGSVENNDVLILCTSGFSEVYTQGEVKAALSVRDLRDASDRLVTKMVSASFEKPTGVFLAKITTLSKGSDATKVGEGGSVHQEWPKVRGSDTGFGQKRSLIKRLLERIIENRIEVNEEKFEAKTTFQRRKTALSVGLILILILISSILFGLKRKAVIEFERDFGDRIAQAEHDLSSAIDLVGLDPERSRELFARSSELYYEMLDEGIDDERLVRLGDELNHSRESVLGVYETEAEVFWDLTLLSDGFSGKELSKSAETVFVLSSQGDRIASIRIENKRSKIEVGPSILGGAERMTSYVNRIFVINDRKLVEVTNGEEKDIDSVSTNNFLIATFAGNVYLLNSNTSNIYRYSGDGRSFGGRRSWLAEGVDPDFSDIISWAIDGTIWLLSSSGEIYRFSGGNQVSFQVRGVYPELEHPVHLYTEEESEGLYLLEPSKNRVVVLGKDGNYKAQYTSDDLKEAEQLVVSEEEGLMIFLTGSKLHSIELKHL